MNAAHKITWTKEIPTEDGMYWFQSEETSPKLVEIIDGEVKVGRWIFETKTGLFQGRWSQATKF